STFHRACDHRTWRRRFQSATLHQNKYHSRSKAENRYDRQSRLRRTAAAAIAADRCGVEPASDLRHLMRTWGRVVRFEVHKHVAQIGKLLQQLSLGRVPDAVTVGNSAS